MLNMANTGHWVILYQGVWFGYLTIRKSVQDGEAHGHWVMKCVACVGIYAITHLDVTA